MTWHEWVESTFAHLLNKKAPNLSEEEKREQAEATPFSKKALVVSGIVTLSSVVAGCGEPEYTAYDECVWEDQNGNKHYNCDDDNDTFYTSNSYSGKKHKLTSSSKYYQYQMQKGGIGSGSSGGFGG